MVEEQIAVDAPPALEDGEGAAGVLAGAVPMLGSLGSVVLVATMATSDGNGQRSLLAAGGFLLGTLAFVAVQLDRQRSRRRRRRDAARRGYLRHLAEVRCRLLAGATSQRALLTARHPPPSELPRLVAAGALDVRVPDPCWEVRYAVGDGAPRVVAAPVGAATGAEPDPAALDARRRLLAAHRRVTSLPLLVDLATTSRLHVGGDRAASRDVARAVVAQAVAAHPSGRLELVALVAEEARPDWEWLKWLPHLCGTVEPGAEVPAGVRRLVLVDGSDPPDAGQVADLTTVLHVGGGDEDGGVRLRVTPDGAVVLLDGRGEPVSARADRCGVATAEALARRLRGREPASGKPGATPDDAEAVLHAVLSADRPEGWRRPGRLRVAIGSGPDGRAFHLDLEESARGGDGPHGLVVGATGSGKSELLRTLVLGLAAGHPPERLTYVLVDFKGGATFSGLASLPHVVGSVTNLADDLTLVDRLQDALAGELLRRQEVLRRAGVASLHDHDAVRSTGAALAALPRLLVVVDEFAEMLSARPGFLDTFAAIGRLGRSLGIHLLLASQRLDEGRLRGLEAHLSYRFALRTFSAAESRAVLGLPVAAELPAQPGAGYLLTGPGEPTRFVSAYVSGAVSQPGPAAVVRPFAWPEEPPAGPATGRSAGPTLVDAVVARLARSARPADAIWLPPLDAPATLGELLGPLRTEPGRGLVATSVRPDPLVLPIGTVDRPREQRREPWLVDLAAAGGHVAVVGGPRTGRTTTLLTLAGGLVLTHTPREAQLVLLDLAGGGLAALSRLPHVAGEASTAEPEVLGRIVLRLGELLDRRQAWWRDHGITDLAAYRRLLREGERGDGHGEVFVVVDGWDTVRADHDDLDQALTRLAGRGLALGVHLLVATGRWADLRATLRGQLGTRVELRLGDPLDSEVDRHAARLVPADRPGRGLTSRGHHALTALPRLDGDADPSTVATGIADLVARVAGDWPEQPVPRLGRLPEAVDLPALRGRADAGDRVLLGADDRHAVTLDPAADPHLLVLGDRGTGRTTVLRTVASEVVRAHRPGHAQLVLVDPRGTLAGAVPASHLLGHHQGPTGAGPALRELAAHLAARRPGHTGAEVVVLVDDHELLAPGTLAPFLPLLPLAHDVGVRLVLTRRTAGAARAFHEPDLRALRELGSPTLLLPGNPAEGPLVGRLTPRPGPPGRARLIGSGGDVTELQVAREADR